MPIQTTGKGLPRQIPTTRAPSHFDAAPREVTDSGGASTSSFGPGTMSVAVAKAMGSEAAMTRSGSGVVVSREGGHRGAPAGVKVIWTHEAEHLSTLVTSANRPPPDPESSLRRLHQLAEQRQLTITPVKLVLQEYNFKRELLVNNIENEEVCERIPVEDIIKPIYKESNDPNDSYNNLLMFNVNASSNAKEGPPQHEMHIFQCVSAPAHEIVDALLQQEGYNPQILADQPNAYVEDEELYEEDMPANQAELPAGITPHQMSEKAVIDAEILLLNMCFDDIESYVGHIYKLQRAASFCVGNSNNSAVGAAAAVEDNVATATASAGGSGEVGSKKDDSGKKKKKLRFIFKRRTSSNAGIKDKKGGINRITSNTSLASEVEIPISDDELVDLFEKIKFSIILLSRLEGYVTEPNPPLLTHKLFTMMKQPIDFIRDPITLKPEMARKVVSPLFTEAAIRLIQNSLIEPEVSLWHELGEGWCIPKDHWRSEVPVYIPRFKCGFKPDPENYHPTLFGVTPIKANKGENGSSQSLTGRGKGAGGAGVAHSPSRDDFLNFLRSRGAKIARVKRDFHAEGEQEISLKAGEYVEVVDSSLNWNRLRNRHGDDGYAPYTVLEYHVV